MRTDHSKYYYFKLIEKFKSSNVTVKEFCIQHSLNNKTYYYWKKKYETRGGRGFLPVVIDETQSIKASAITIQYPDGTHLVFEGNADASVLKQLLPAFNK